MNQTCYKSFFSVHTSSTHPLCGSVDDDTAVYTVTLSVDDADRVGLVVDLPDGARAEVHRGIAGRMGGLHLSRLVGVQPVGLPAMREDGMSHETRLKACAAALIEAKATVVGGVENETLPWLRLGACTYVALTSQTQACLHHRHSPSHKHTHTNRRMALQGLPEMSAW